MSKHTDALRGIRCFGPEHFEHLAGLIAERDELLEALRILRTKLRENVKMDVKKHFGLMTADAQAGTTIAKAEVQQ